MNTLEKALRGESVIAIFPPSLVIAHSDRRGTVLLPDPRNGQNTWYVDISSFFQNDGTGEEVKPEFRSYLETKELIT